MPNVYYKQLAESGENLIKAIGGLTQIARMHMDNNPVLMDAAKKFIDLIKEASEKENSVSLAHSDGRFYFQKIKLYNRAENKRLFIRMLQYLEKRNIYSLDFQSSLEGVAPNSIIAFARLIDQADKHNSPIEWLKTRFEDHKIHWVDINQYVVDHADDPEQQVDDEIEPDELAIKKAQARKQYAHIFSSVKDVSRKLSAGHNVGMRNSVRLVQKMVDIIGDDESSFSILGTLRIYDDYTYIHSLNVAILSMCLGKQIGLDHMMLERLGLCGLFHDLGKLEIPKSLLNKRGRLNDEEFAVIKTHPVHSARLILKMKARRDRKIKILMAPFEHHMGFNHSGYPQTKMNRSISLFGRILTIADVYDAITSARYYRDKIMSPDRALGYMLEESGTSFDPVLLKIFINMLGAFPVGTLVDLDTSEMGLVISPSKGEDRTHPIVQLLELDAKKKYQKGAVVDLSERNPRTGKHLRNIIETRHPSDLGIQAAAYLL